MTKRIEVCCRPFGDVQVFKFVFIVKPNGAFLNTTFQGAPVQIAGNDLPDLFANAFQNIPWEGSIRKTLSKAFHIDSFIVHFKP